MSVQDKLPTSQVNIHYSGKLDCNLDGFACPWPIYQNGNSILETSSIHNDLFRDQNKVFNIEMDI